MEPRRAVVGLVVSTLAAAVLGCGLMVRLEPEPKDPGECGAADECNDGIDCTRDECREDGKCAHKAAHELCSADERCDPRAGCIPGRACESDADCQDLDPCNGTETCDPEGFCASGGPLQCDDGVFCNGDEICRPGAGCEPGAPRTCSDGIDCTADRCDEGARECVNAPEDSLCDDSEYCNGAEACIPGVGCQHGQPPCDDRIDCSEDQCVEERDACLHHGIHERCDPGELCRPTDDGFECARIECDLVGKATQCDDLDGCNGVERCGDDGYCQPGLGLPCDDGVFCNGAEFCDEWCRAQEPPSCFDGVDCTTDSCDAAADQCVHLGDDLWCDDDLACTTDVCSEGGCDRSDLVCDDEVACTVDYCSEERGGCTQDPPDQDRDGYGDDRCGGDDCDDADPWVNPGWDEVCNGLDEDCDLVADDGFECRAGDGSACETSCLSSGWQICERPDCTWSDCVPPPENCNGEDDDCDEGADEGCDCVPGDPDEDCKTPCDTTGTRSCGNDGRWGPCVAPPEECNGEDDDCAGGPDDPFECVQGSAEACPPACDEGSDGTRNCSDQCTWDPCVPPAEVCNGLDDDCDGRRDEIFACEQGSSGPCLPSCEEGGGGTATCSGWCTWGPCVPPAEDCNGLDDDCSGLCDDGFACCANAPFGTCLTECDTIGAGRCDGNCEVVSSVCDPPAEVCNSRDDDCQLGPDDTFECAAWVDEQICATGIGEVLGRQRCDTDCEWGECCAASDLCGNGVDDNCNNQVDEVNCCDPRQEIEDLCDGVDDDCDGLCDEDGGPCCLGEIGYCLTDCNTVGWRNCMADPDQVPSPCLWDECQPFGENCQNGYDDDCDDLVDDADPECLLPL